MNFGLQTTKMGVNVRVGTAEVAGMAMKSIGDAQGMTEETFAEGIGMAATRMEGTI